MKEIKEYRLNQYDYEKVCEKQSTINDFITTFGILGVIVVMYGIYFIFDYLIKYF